MKATSLNLRVLAEHFAGSDTATNRIDSVSMSHMRRCLKLGLIAVEGKTQLCLTDAGREALAALKGDR